MLNFVQCMPLLICQLNIINIQNSIAYICRGEGYDLAYSQLGLQACASVYMDGNAPRVHANRLFKSRVHDERCL